MSMIRRVCGDGEVFTLYMCGLIGVANINTVSCGLHCSCSDPVLFVYVCVPSHLVSMCPVAFV
jgi:hypothetical protein